MLVGRLQAQAAGKWQARWSYFKEGRAWDWQLDGNLIEALAAGLDGAAEVLAADIINSKPTNEQGVIKVLVKNIFTVDDYARTDSYLRSFDNVVDVQASQVERKQVLFNLVLRGSSDGLQRAVQLSDRRILQAESLPVLPPQPPAVNPQLTTQPEVMRPDLVYSLLP